MDTEDIAGCSEGGEQVYACGGGLKKLTYTARRASETGEEWEASGRGELEAEQTWRIRGR